MKTTLLMCAAMLLCTSISAQTVITRISAGEDFYYYNNELQTVFNDASPGDTILIPGQQYPGNFTVPTTVVIIGVGYLPSSSTATGISFIEGTLTMNSGASGSEVIGLKIGNNLSLASNATDFVLQRLKVEGDLTANNSSMNILITECIFSDPSTGSSANSLISIGGADNVEINNSIIEGINTNSFGQNLVVNNCIIFDGFSGTNGAVFNCNVIDGAFNILGSGTTENDNIFNNNVVLDPGCSDICLTTDIGSDNVANNTLYVTDVSVFGEDLTDYALLGNDYFILDTSPAFTHCPTGQQVGIYNGPQPFKIGAIPINPHISSKVIAGVSTTDQINVEVGVEAQDN